MHLHYLCFYYNFFQLCWCACFKSLFRFCNMFFFREISTGKSVERNVGAFVIHVSDDELENDIESKDEEVHNGSLVAVKRFTCHELYLRYVLFSGPVNLCALFNKIVALPISYCCGKLMFVFSNNIKCIAGLLLSFSESDDSDDNIAFGDESFFMDEVGLVDGALVELTHQHQLGVKVCIILWLFKRRPIGLNDYNFTVFLPPPQFWMIISVIFTLFSCQR